MGTLTWPWRYFRTSGTTASRLDDNTDEAVDAILESLSSIDREEIRRGFPGSPRLKYLNFERFIGRDVAYCRLLGLDRMAPARILDIGCGTGLFLYSARYFGHSGVGIDVEDEFYLCFAAAIGVDRRVAPVAPLEPLRVDGPFDLVTAIATTFDRYVSAEEVSRVSGVWGSREWVFFLTDIQRLLTPTGRLFLKLNKTGHEDRPVVLTGGTRKLLFDRADIARKIEELSR
jgi:SAM-dependent methyltransferase